MFLNSFNLFAGNFDVVARVNDKIITNYDLNNYVNISQLFFKDTDNSKNFRQEILDWIIDNILKNNLLIGIFGGELYNALPEMQ